MQFKSNFACCKSRLIPLWGWREGKSDLRSIPRSLQSLQWQTERTLMLGLCCQKFQEHAWTWGVSGWIFWSRKWGWQHPRNSSGSLLNPSYSRLIWLCPTSIEKRCLHTKRQHIIDIVSSRDVLPKRVLIQKWHDSRREQILAKLF